MHLAGVLCAFLCLLAVLSDGGATLSKKDKKGKKKKEKVGLHDWCMYLILWVRPWPLYQLGHQGLHR